MPNAFYFELNVGDRIEVYTAGSERGLMEKVEVHRKPISRRDYMDEFLSRVPRESQ